jgi:type IV secretion system protein VirB2
MNRTKVLSALALSAVLTPARTSWAQLSFGACCPWNGPLDAIVTNITGPTVKAIAILLVIGAGIGFASTEGGAFRKLAGVVFGLSIAFAAATWAPGFFGYTGP